MSADTYPHSKHHVGPSGSFVMIGRVAGVNDGLPGECCLLVEGAHKNQGPANFFVDLTQVQQGLPRTLLTPGVRVFAPSVPSRSSERVTGHSHVLQGGRLFLIPPQAQ